MNKSHGLAGWITQCSWAGQTQTQDASTPRSSCRWRAAAEVSGRLCFSLPALYSWLCSLKAWLSGWLAVRPLTLLYYLGLNPHLHNGVHSTYTDYTAAREQQACK